MCTSRMVGIAAVLALVTGGIVVGVIFALKNDCEAIKPPINLEIQAEDQQLKVSWSDIPDVCGTSYRVEGHYPDKVVSYVTEDLFQYFELPPSCIEVLIVVVRLADEDRASLGISQTYITGTDAIQVPNFKLSDESGVLKAEWDAPDNLEYCNITDTVVYELNSGPQYWATTSLEILLPNYSGYIPCNLANFSILPIIDEVRGSEVTDSIEIALPDTFGADFQYISGVVSDNDHHFIRMKWELGDIGVCPIEYLVSCSDADTPAQEEQISSPSFDFKACPILDIISGHHITVTIRPLLPGVSPDLDRDGQARICEFYAYYESFWWFLTGDCIPLDKEQKLA